MKLFHFYRNEDQSGVSGTGPVVEGVQFTNGWCALRWISGTSSVCFYQSLEEVKAIHGHEGKTEIITHDFAPLKKRNDEEGSIRMEQLINIFERTSRLVTLGEEQIYSPEELRLEIREISAMLEDLGESILLPKQAA